MLFDIVSDSTYIDLVDEHGKLFKRFRSQVEYDEFVSRFSSEDLKGLVRKDLVVKWYENNWEITKLVLVVFAFAYILYTVFTGL